MSPRITVLIVTFNSRRFYPRLKATLEAQTVPYELIVLDNGSRPEDRPSADDFPDGAVLLQQERNLGFAEGNNAAAKAAKTEFVALLNPDAFPEPTWLEELLAMAGRCPNDTLIGSTQIWDPDPSLLDGIGDVMHASGLAYRSAHKKPFAEVSIEEGQVFSACAAAMLVRREVFLNLGGFDESYFCYMEDVDFGFRLRLAGGRAVQAPLARVSHVSGGVSAGHSGFADFHGARNRLWTFVKCMPAPLFWPLFPVHLAATFAVLCVHASRGRWASWQGFAAGLAGLNRAWKARARAQAHRRASAWQIACALRWAPFPTNRRRRSGPALR
jgi:GT2 family glycosyltransferase